MSNITDEMIEVLRAEAAEEGDGATVVICAIALGRLDPVETAEHWEERYGGGGFSQEEERFIRAHGRSVEVARAKCHRLAQQQALDAE